MSDPETGEVMYLIMIMTLARKLGVKPAEFAKMMSNHEEMMKTKKYATEYALGMLKDHLSSPDKKKK